MRLHKYLLAGLATAFFAMPSMASADIVLFDFFDNGVLDNGPALPVSFDSLPGENGEIVTLTVTSASALDSVTGDVIAASTGIRSNALGVDNPTLTGNNEGGDIQNGESFTFEFDQDVTLDNLDIASFGTDGFLTVSIDGLTVDINNGDFAGNEFTGFLVDGAPQIIPAGTDITIGGTSTAADGSLSLRITDITVSIVPSIDTPAVPEPSSLALLGLAGLGLVTRRRR